MIANQIAKVVLILIPSTKEVNRFLGKNIKKHDLFPLVSDYI